MFSYKISAEIELRLLEERHAEQVFDLIVEDRERHPEVDKNLSLDDVNKKIKRDLALFVRLLQSQATIGLLINSSLFFICAS